MNFLEFINQRNINNNIYENLKSKNDDRILQLIISLVKKKIDGEVVLWNKDPIEVKISNKQYLSYMFLHIKSKKIETVFSLNFLQENNANQIFSIDFFDKTNSGSLLFGDGKSSSNLSIYTLGSSIAYFIPIISKLCNTHDWNLTQNDAKRISNELFKEAYNYRIGSANYLVIENLSYDIIYDTYNITINEQTEAEKYREQKRKEMSDAYTDNNQDLFYKLSAEYADIVKAIEGGAKTLKDLKLSVKKDVKVEIPLSPELKKSAQTIETKAAKQSKDGRKDPQQVFKEMEAYIDMVMKGLSPGLIICGTSGVGKSWRVENTLKKYGYKDETPNMKIIKAKCTTPMLYLELYERRQKGQIIVIDDADSLVGPKAAEDTINILKAALDSTKAPEGRKITYRVKTNIVDDNGNEVPKQFYYNGSIIVITNYNVGQLDTAFRGRMLTQTIDFSQDQILQLIKDIMQNIEPDKLSLEAKLKAYYYLDELVKAKTKVVITLRSFISAANIFEIGIDDQTAKSMIKEQMANQALVGGKHF